MSKFQYENKWHITFLWFKCSYLWIPFNPKVSIVQFHYKPFCCCILCSSRYWKMAQHQKDFPIHTHNCVRCVFFCVWIFFVVAFFYFFYFFIYWHFSEYFFFFVFVFSSQWNLFFRCIFGGGQFLNHFSLDSMKKNYRTNNSNNCIRTV